MTARQHTILMQMAPDAIAVAALVVAASAGQDSHGVSLDARLKPELEQLRERLERLAKLAEELGE